MGPSFVEPEVQDYSQEVSNLDRANLLHDSFIFPMLGCEETIWFSSCFNHLAVVEADGSRHQQRRNECHRTLFFEGQMPAESLIEANFENAF